MRQSGTISNNTVTGGPFNGLVSYAFISDSAAANISQTFLVTGNHFTDDRNGVFISASAAGANGKINGSWTLAGNTITYNFNGVNVGGTNAPVTENVFLSSAGVTNQITGNSRALYGHTLNGAVVNIQNLLNNNFNNNGTVTFGNANFSN